LTNLWKIENFRLFYLSIKIISLFLKCMKMQFWDRNIWPLYVSKSRIEQILTYICPGVNFINILRSNFLYKHCFGSFFYVHVTREKLLKQRSYEKFIHKMLMKLTPQFFDLNADKHGMWASQKENNWNQGKIKLYNTMI